jgi:adenylate cyclase, class 2
MKNIELKAKYENLTEAESLAVEIGAKFQWSKKQVDTYFKAPNGRLKLREVDGKTSELISYFRENKTARKESNYSILTISDGELFKNMLAKNLGILVVVSKVRKLYQSENVRIHLDQVESLGDYLEFEGVIKNDSEIETTKKKVDFLMEQFKIETKNLVKYSYSDLLLDK